MANLTEEQAGQIWRDWLGAFKASGMVSVAEAKTDFTNQYVAAQAVEDAMILARAGHDRDLRISPAFALPLRETLFVPRRER